MDGPMDRREIVKVFRERLDEVIRRSGGTRSAFAGKIGLDRTRPAEQPRRASARTAWTTSF